MKYDLPSKEKLDKYVKAGLLRRSDHKELPLHIYTYTIFTNFEKLWNSTTKQARGMVFDDNGRCVVRPVPKFFNEGEELAMLGRDESQKVVVQEKLDGSMIQVVNDEEYGIVVTSKGSFHSKQVEWAKEIIEEEQTSGFGFGAKRASDIEKKPAYIEFFEPGFTYVFELIHPENQEYLVVNYHGDKRLYLWAVVNNETGEELNIYDWQRVKRFDRVAQVFDLEEYLTKNNIEGVVVKTGTHRYKVKTGEYLRLHRLVSDYTPKRVWEALKNGDTLEFQDMPEEFENWLNDTIKELTEAYAQKRDEVEAEYGRCKSWSRKRVAVSHKLEYKPIMFSLMDGKDISKQVWDLVEPSANKEEGKENG